MATKATFILDEWKMIMGSPMLAGMAVSLAEPSGIWGMMKEGMASGSALLNAKRDAGANELAKALVADMETSDGRSVARDGLKSVAHWQVACGDQAASDDVPDEGRGKFLIPKRRKTPPHSKLGSST